MIASKQEIQVRSYFIWEKEGRPQGRELEHWFRAERELSAQSAALERVTAAISTTPAGKTAKSAAKTKGEKAKTAK